MANISKEELGLLSELRKKEPLLNAGGVLSLYSYLSITKPEILEKIEGEKAIVEAKELDDGKLYLFIKLPLIDNSYEELRVWVNGTLEEGDEVWISSIVALFLVNTKGETTVRFDARCDEKQKPQNVEDLKVDIIERCTDLMLDFNHTEMSDNISFEGEICPKLKYGILKSNNSVIICTPYALEWYEESSSWQIINLKGYCNARPLTHGLIFAERMCNKKNSNKIIGSNVTMHSVSDRHQIKTFDVLNSDGSILINDVNSLDFGPDYLVANEILWWFNYRENLWEVKNLSESLPDQINRIGIEKETISLKKLQINDDLYFYIFQNTFDEEKDIYYDEGSYDQEFYQGTYIGLVNKYGNWSIKANTNIEKIINCLSVIIVQNDKNFDIYDSEKYERGQLKRICTVEKCWIDDGKYLVLTNGTLQGLFDTRNKMFVIEFCVEDKYVLIPHTASEGMIGVYCIDKEQKRSRVIERKRYYFLDYNGKVKLEIEKNFEIVTGFHDNKAVISQTDYYHGNYYKRIINKNGEVLNSTHETFSGEIDDYYENDMRNLERDNWDAMTDGMYGDYPEEGYDGDYESLGY